MSDLKDYGLDGESREGTATDEPDLLIADEAHRLDMNGWNQMIGRMNRHAAAFAKNSAAVGTAIHRLTEQMLGHSLLPDKTPDQAAWEEVLGAPEHTFVGSTGSLEPLLKDGNRYWTNPRLTPVQKEYLDWVRTGRLDYSNAIRSHLKKKKDK